MESIDECAADAGGADAWDERVLRVRGDMAEGKYIHFDNAGASPPPRPVLQAVKDVLDAEHLLGGYEAQSVYAGDMEHLYGAIGRLINAKKPTEEVALVDSATTAWVKAFYSIPLAAGDVILVSKVEYGANMVAALQRCRRHGASIAYIPSDESGCVCLAALASILRSTNNVKVVCITWIPTNGGVVNDAAGIGRLIATYDTVLYLLDACQAVGHVRVDVQALGCHLLTATGRKYLRGPRGTGFLYASETALRLLGEPVTIDHHAAPWTELGDYTLKPSARRFEQWEKNISGLIGLGAAIEYYLDDKNVGAEWAERRIRCLATKLRSSLLELNKIDIPVRQNTGGIFSSMFAAGGDTPADFQESHIKLHDLGDPLAASAQCGIVTFSVGSSSAQIVKKLLREHNIFVSVSSPPSTLIDASERSLPDIVRASLHYFNTELEVFLFCDAIKEIICK
jgi:cysteine desulfurase/selenocysteine lyase